MKIALTSYQFPGQRTRRPCPEPWRWPWFRPGRLVGAMRPVSFATVLAVALLFAPYGVFGQDGSPTPTPPAESAAQAPNGEDPEREIRARRAELASEIAVLHERVAAVAEGSDLEAQITAQLELLERSDRVYGQQLAARERLRALLTADEELAQRLAAEPPGTLSEARGYRGERAQDREE